MDPTVTFAIQIAAAVPLAWTCVYALRTRRPSGARRSPRMLVLDGAFVAPADPALRRVTVLIPASVLVLAVVSLLTSNTDDLATTLEVAGFVLWLATLGLGLGAVVLGIITLRRPSFALTPNGVRAPLRRWSWERLDDALPPALPAPTPRLKGGWPFSEMDADPLFVGAAIEHYRLHPAARAEIGTSEEYARLLTALTSVAE